MSEQDPSMQPLEAMQALQAAELQRQAEQQPVPTEVASEVGHAAFDLVEVADKRESLTARGIFSPEAALLQLTNQRPEGVISLLKPDSTTIGNSESVLLASESMPAVSPTDVETALNSSLELFKSEGYGVSPPVPAGSVGKESFDQTQRDRKMFERSGTAMGPTKNETYFNQLFVGANNEDLKKHVLESLKGKRILNIGGGNARLTEELRANGAEDVEVVNIEPYPSDKVNDADGYDHVVEHNPAAEDFFEQSEMPEGQADEIWAVYSVPAYLGSSKEVTALFGNLKRAIKPGGVIRISHVGFAGTVDGSGGDRIAALEQSLTSAASEGYLVEVVKVRNNEKTLIMKAPETKVA